MVSINIRGVRHVGRNRTVIKVGKRWKHGSTQNRIHKIYSNVRRARQRKSILASNAHLSHRSQSELIHKDQSPDCARKLLGYLKTMGASTQLELCKTLIDNHPFDLSQLISLRAAIDNRIRLDIISGLPYEIALYIMTFLSPEDLCRAAQTCKSWRTVCEDSRLWREKCAEEGLLDDKHTLEVLFRKRISIRNSKQEHFANHALSSNLPKSEWKLAYSKHINILRNWKTRKFEISEPFIGLNQIFENHSTENNRNRLNLPTSIDINNAPVSASTRSNVRRALERQSSDSSNALNTSKGVCQGGPSESSVASDYYVYNDLKSNSCGVGTSTGIDHNKYLMQLRCHEDSVITCLQFNPRTNTIVSGSDDQTLKVWSSETGRCITTLEGHTGGVWSSQLSPDDIVISGSTDRTLRVWKAHTGEMLHTLYGHTSTVRCLALDGDRVVSGSRDASLRLWDIFKGVCLNVFLGHSAAVRCVEYKNNVIVSGAYDHLVMVWDAITGTCRYSLQCHYSRIYSLQFDGNTIASGSLDSTICIWDASNGTLRHHLEGHKSLTSKMQLEGNLLVSANADSFCKVWDVNTGECLQTLGGENKHTSAITSVYFNSKYVVTSSDDGTVKLWDIKTGRFIKDLIVLPTASQGGVVWRIRASYTKLICAVGSRTQTEDTHLLVLDFSA